ncbi:hypothetical protein [Streptomyces sp. MI02-7b]|uniref:hypothetical protein n=1 Tax=Streptomyces sp. MI02-7b TaxID=462941 RepID=UPI0029B91D35|nr:hypothetical protein [Streptomyces sp. MI02-7b]MDX3070849.1 hypothetical protein [Streptomyces sp. MI02-7b]
MFRKSDDTSRVRVAVMSLTAEAQFLEVRIRHLREEIAEVDTQLDALGESLRGLLGSARSNADPGSGTGGPPGI